MRKDASHVNTIYGISYYVIDERYGFNDRPSLKLQYGMMISIWNYILTYFAEKEYLNQN